jgi:hypothetical protein
MTKKSLHKLSGYTVYSDVQYHPDINRYFSGFFLVNPEGMRTNRIAPSPRAFTSENDAEEYSIEEGKKALPSYLSRPFDFSNPLQPD